jgi:hypothetical protein
MSAVEELQGQATYEMANLRPSTTGLPPNIVVFISQRGGAKHDVRVKVSTNGPKVREDQMSVYAVRPFGYRAGPALSGHDEQLLRAWVEANQRVLVEFWDGDIGYTEDALEQLVKV